MDQIIARNLAELRKRHGEYGVKRLRDALINEENLYSIHKELGVSLVVLAFFSKNIPAFIRATEEKKSHLTLVYSRQAA